LEVINGANDVEFSFPYEWHGQYLNQSSRAFFDSLFERIASDGPGRLARSR
jgi:hypothetical protein